tara:strand:- start:5097 stop:7058 length:1962 start_codon:yes stop_codon:yes gene_type:complete
MNIFINNLNPQYLSKIKNLFFNQKEQKFYNISSIYTNVKVLDNLIFVKTPIIYIENITKADSLSKLITEKNIHILFTDIVCNLVNVKNPHFYISTLYKHSNPNVYFYKNLAPVITDLDNIFTSDTTQIALNTCNETNITKTKDTPLSKNNPKQFYREICLRYLDNFKRLRIPDLYLNLEKEAILVEYRSLPHLEVLVRNMIYQLGNKWSYTIVCGLNNYNEIKYFCNNISPNIRIINTYQHNITQNDYNTLLCSTDFWDLFNGETLLIYQEDTCIFNNIPEKWLQYDYIGGAFGPQSVSPLNVGNGGFSLRTKQIMKEVINTFPATHFNSNKSFINNYKKTAKLDLYPEDNYFPQTMQDLQIGKVAPYDIAKQFSSEQVFTDQCIGMHCMWFSNNNWESYVINYFDTIFKNVIKHKSFYPHIPLDIYILHCEEFKDRDLLINSAVNQLKEEGNQNINVFKSVDSSKTSLNKETQLQLLKLYDNNLKFKDENAFIFNKSGQIGCYLGHHLAIKHIFDNQSKLTSKYSIIFEDDIILQQNFSKSIYDIIQYFEKANETFDLIYLGSLNDNKGHVQYSNIFHLNKHFWHFGAHGLLINNNSVKKLYELNCEILHEIDNHYKLLFNKDLIKAYYINKPIVHQNRKIFSYINLKTHNY